MPSQQQPRTPWYSLGGGCLESRFNVPGRHGGLYGPVTLPACASACESHRDAFIQHSLTANTSQMYAWRTEFEPSSVRSSFSPMGGACGAFSFFDVTAAVPESRRPPPLMPGAEPVPIGFCTLKAFFCTLPPYKIRFGACTPSSSWKRRDASKRGYCTCKLWPAQEPTCACPIPMPDSRNMHVVHVTDRSCCSPLRITPADVLAAPSGPKDRGPFSHPPKSDIEQQRRGGCAQGELLPTLVNLSAADLDAIGPWSRSTGASARWSDWNRSAGSALALHGNNAGPREASAAGDGGGDGNGDDQTGGSGTGTVTGDGGNSASNPSRRLASQVEGGPARATPRAVYYECVGSYFKPVGDGRSVLISQLAILGGRPCRTSTRVPHQHPHAAPAPACRTSMQPRQHAARHPRASSPRA